jgi:hypothetical protein
MNRSRVLRFARGVVLAVFAPVVAAHAATVQFVVAETGIPVHGDSYILTLVDPADIAHARGLIAGDPTVGGTIVVAAIAKGADGVNRDFLAPGKPPWSWHITAFEGFADVTAEILDGWPSFVEQDVDGWIANTGGFIGFWNYTVVAEVTAVPLPAAFVLLASTLAVCSVRPRRAASRAS